METDASLEILIGTTAMLQLLKTQNLGTVDGDRCNSNVAVEKIIE